MATLPLHAPRIGAQGAALAGAPATFGVALGAVIPTVSRAILAAGPDGIASAIDATAREVASWPR
jgi:orotidine-5'-phosphate decarboxylase